MFSCFILFFFNSFILVPDGNKNTWRRPGVSLPLTLLLNIDPSAKMERNINHLLPLLPVTVASFARPASLPLPLPLPLPLTLTLTLRLTLPLPLRCCYG